MIKENRNVILIGMPGVGKTTVGVLLAERLGFAFMDTDITIQIREKRRLQDIIDMEGLEAFRRVEERAILSIAVHAHVIATGGSVVYSKKAIRHLRSGGTVCHLDADTHCLLSRIDNLEDRGIAMAPGQSIASLHAERHALYVQSAHFSIDTGDKTPAQVVKSVIHTLQHRFGYSR